MSMISLMDSSFEAAGTGMPQALEPRAILRKPCAGSEKQKTPPRGEVFQAVSSAKDLVFLRLENLFAAVHARFQVDVVRTAKLARGGIFDIRIHVEAIVRAAHTGARLRFLTLGDSHGTIPESGLAAHPCGTRERAPVNAARALWQAPNGRIFSGRPCNEKGRPEGRPRYARRTPVLCPGKKPDWLCTDSVG